MRRAISDLLLSACALCVVLATLMAFDGRLRERVTTHVGTTRASADVAAAGEQAHSLIAIVVEVAKDQSRQHAPMMIFLAAATALTLFMVRS
jgi:hypothetical protein